MRHHNFSKWLSTHHNAKHYYDNLRLNQTKSSKMSHPALNSGEQCYRCQKFGHPARTTTQSPVHVLCNGNHHSIVYIDSRTPAIHDSHAMWMATADTLVLQVPSWPKDVPWPPSPLKKEMDTAPSTPPSSSRLMLAPSVTSACDTADSSIQCSIPWGTQHWWSTTHLMHVLPSAKFCRLDRWGRHLSGLLVHPWETHISTLYGSHWCQRLNFPGPEHPSITERGVVQCIPAKDLFRSLFLAYWVLLASYQGTSHPIVSAATRNNPVTIYNMLLPLHA